jgi:predicted nuclease with TOPRIM domain
MKTMKLSPELEAKLKVLIDQKNTLIDEHNRITSEHMPKQKQLTALVKECSRIKKDQLDPLIKQIKRIGRDIWDEIYKEIPEARDFASSFKRDTMTIEISDEKLGYDPVVSDLLDLLLKACK